MRTIALLLYIIIYATVAQAQGCDTLVRKVIGTAEETQAGTHFVHFPMYCNSQALLKRELDTGQPLKKGQQSVLVGKAIERHMGTYKHFHDYADFYFYPAKEKDKLYIKGDVFTGPRTTPDSCYYLVTFTDSTTLKVPCPKLSMYTMGYFILLEGAIDYFVLVDKIENWADQRAKHMDGQRAKKQREVRVLQAQDGLKELFMTKPMLSIIKYCRKEYEYDEQTEKYVLASPGQFEPFEHFLFKDGEGEQLMQALRCVVNR